MNIDEKIEQLEVAREDITKEINSCRSIRAHRRFGKMTIDEISNEWNNSNGDHRWLMMADIQELVDILEGNSPDCRNADEEEIIRYEFNEDNDLGIDLPDYFVEFCKAENGKKQAKTEAAQ